MHNIMVGVRMDEQCAPDLFGCDEINELIRHGMKVVSVRPGECYQGNLHDGGFHSIVCYWTVVLDDYGMDPAKRDGAFCRNDNELNQESKPTDEIPW